jgi:hypothetical protein
MGPRTIRDSAIPASWTAFTPYYLLLFLKFFNQLPGFNVPCRRLFNGKNQIPGLTLRQSKFFSVDPESQLEWRGQMQTHRATHFVGKFTVAAQVQPEATENLLEIRRLPAQATNLPASKEVQAARKYPQLAMPRFRL